MVQPRGVGNRAAPDFQISRREGVFSLDMSVSFQRFGSEAAQSGAPLISRLWVEHAPLQQTIVYTLAEGHLQGPSSLVFWLGRGVIEGIPPDNSSRNQEVSRLASRLS